MRFLQVQKRRNFRKRIRLACENIPRLTTEGKIFATGGKLSGRLAS